jgi:hypothetical protein
MTSQGKILFSLHVDDIFYASTSQSLTQDFLVLELPL